jgi:hypothetical protein
LSRPASVAGVPSSEARVKRGERIVGIDTELVEKLGRNDPRPASADTSPDGDLQTGRAVPP